MGETKESKRQKCQRVKRERKDWAPTLVDSVPIIRIHSFQFCPR